MAQQSKVAMPSTGCNMSSGSDILQFPCNCKESEIFVLMIYEIHFCADCEEVPGDEGLEI